MRRNQISKVDIPALVAAYREAADRHGEATERGDYKTANKAASLISAIYSELRRRGPDAQRALMSLLFDPSPGVRGWVAAHALEFAPKEGEIVLTRLTQVGKFIGFSAEITLKERRAGRLRFP